LGSMPCLPVQDASTPRASGTLEAHYAPRTPVVIVATEQMEQAIRQLHAAKRKVALLHYTPVAAIAMKSILAADNAAHYAYQLYASLRTLDQANADVILVQAPPAGSEWQGVHDRLKRAAHDSLGVLAKLLA